VVRSCCRETGTTGREHSPRQQSQAASELRRVDISDTDSVIAACHRGSTAVGGVAHQSETWTVADIPALCVAAHAEGLRVAVDNTFMTPSVNDP